MEDTPEFSLESIPEVERAAESVESGTPIAKVESFLADVREGAQETSPKSIAERASELAELVDEMLDDLQEVETSHSGQAPGIQKLHPSHTAGPSSANHLEEPTSDASEATSQSEIIGRQVNESKLLRADKSHLDGVSTMDEPASGRQVSQHEEALRYLLHHLKEIKDKA